MELSIACSAHRFHHQIWSDGSEGVDSFYVSQNIAHQAEGTCMQCTHITHGEDVFYDASILCVAAGQVLHAVGVCFADVPVINTSTVVVQILVQLLSNRATVCCLHHCYLPHDQGECSSYLHSSGRGCSTITLQSTTPGYATNAGSDILILWPAIICAA